MEEKNKKEHGFNPPTEKQTQRWMNALSDAVYNIMNAFNDMWKTVLSAMEDIKTMPDEEFEEKLQLLTEEQQELAWKIRTGGSCYEDLSNMQKKV